MASVIRPLVYAVTMSSTITSAANPVVKSFRRLHRPKGRIEEFATIIEGPTIFREAVGAGVEIQSVLVEKGDIATIEICEARGLSSELVTAEVLAAASDTVHPQSPVVMIAQPRPDRMHFRDTLVLRDIGDPGNVGTMIRSAAAFGWDVCVTGDSAHPWSPKVIRAGAGAHFRVHLSFSSDPIADARELGLDIAASVVSGGAAPGRGNHPMALLVGSEAHGLSPIDIEASDSLITIPIAAHTESLNAAVAASILMYALAT